METERFDRLATSLAQSPSRRAALRLLAVALLGTGGAGTPALAAARASMASPKHDHAQKHRGRRRHRGHGGGFPGQGTCAGGADACLGVGGPICTCDNGRSTGLCRSQMEGGTVCAIDITRPAVTACDQCKTNGDCARLGFPPGSSCVVDFGPNCARCQDNTLGACVAPCGFREPK